MKKALQNKILALLFLSTITQPEIMAQFVPAQPVVQLPGTPLWTIQGQVRTRGEFRKGVGNPYTNAVGAPAAFISQRTNLNIGFRWDKLNFVMDLRDVRVWGQDAASIDNADGNKLFLHQAWGEFTLATTADTNCKLKIDNLSLKVGRQEISYDDVRLIGNLDWLQQGRRHDAALVKFLHKGYQIDLGLAYNQNTDAFTKAGSSYVPGNVAPYGANSNGVLVPLPANFVPTANGAPVYGTTVSTNGQNSQYKMFEYLYFSRKFNQTKVSMLFFNDQFSQYRNVVLTVGGGTMTGRMYDMNDAIWSRSTLGSQVTHQWGNATEGFKFVVNAGGYFQGGHDRDGKVINAGHGFFYGTATKGRWTFGPGYEYLSGNSTNVSETATGISNVAVGSENNRFDPLYGTPHRWWGYMDYFYTGTGSPNAGLQDVYGRLRYDSKNFFLTLDIHQFMTSGKAIMYKYLDNSKNPLIADASGLNPGDAGYVNTYGYNNLGTNLGNEIDLVANYQINKFTNLEAGYSCYFATDALAPAKGIKMGTTNNFNQWAYLQLNIRPDFLYQKPVAIKQ